MNSHFDPNNPVVIRSKPPAASATMPAHTVHVRSFAAALWLIAKGHQPLDVTRARDSSGNLIYVFPSAAKPDLTEMYVVRDHLNDMGLRARRLAE